MPLRRIVLGLAVLATVAGIAGVGCDGTKPGSGSAVSIIGSEANGFQPPTLTVRAGETVTWTNRDTTGETHGVLDDQGGLLFGSSTLARDSTYRFTFTEAGTYEYYCPRHTVTRGTIVVH